jgi:hypothetical protein
MMMRLFLIVVLVASLGLAVAAQGSHVWSATMTVGGQYNESTDAEFVGYSRDPESQEGFGSLTNPTFIHEGRTYTVDYLYHNYHDDDAEIQPDPQELILGFRPGMDESAVEALTFTAGDDTFDFNLTEPDNNSESTTIYWDLTTLDFTVWQVGQTLAVGLRPTMSTPTPALPLIGAGILTLLLAVGARRRASRY